MIDFNLAPIIGAIVNLVSSSLRYQLDRNELVIHLRKINNLSPDHPPPDFTSVYQHTLVDYGAEKLKNYDIGKLKLELVLKVFRQKEIIQAFREAFDQNKQSVLLERGEEFLDWNILGDQIRELKIDIDKEFTDFRSIFVKVVNSTGTPFEIIQLHKINYLVEQLSPSSWNSYVNLRSVKNLVYFETENSPASLGVAEPDDTGRQEIVLGQGFRLTYQIPFAGYALLMQGFRASWVVIRLGNKCEDVTLGKEACYIKERIVEVPRGRWSVPTNGRYLREKTDVGLHRFALLLTEHPFSERTKKLITQEVSELSSSTLSEFVEYLESKTSSTRLIVTECDIVYQKSNYGSN